jgi:hypothetical protein
MLTPSPTLYIARVFALDVAVNEPAFPRTKQRMHKIAHAIDTHARVVVGSSLLVVHPVLPPVVADFFPPPPLEVLVVFSSVLIMFESF